MTSKFAWLLRLNISGPPAITILALAGPGACGSSTNSRGVSVAQMKDDKNLQKLSDLGRFLSFLVHVTGRAVNKLRTQLRAARFFRSEGHELSALMADPGWKTRWELDERETGKSVLVPGLSVTLLRRGLSRSDQDHWITPNWTGHMDYTWAITHPITHPSVLNGNVDSINSLE